MTYRIDRLPKWAQRRIHRLEEDVHYWKEQVSHANDSDGPIRYRVFMDDDVSIPEAATIYFKVNDLVICVDLRVEKDRQMLNLYAQSGKLVLRPMAGNWVNVEAER